MIRSDGPGAVFDAHVDAEFVQRDVDATMAAIRRGDAGDPVARKRISELAEIA